MDKKRLNEALRERYGETVDTSGLAETNETLLSLATRGSCRDYQKKSVQLSLVQVLCAIALASPTKSDLQQRDIVILENETQRARINALFPKDEWIAKAPAMLVFCGNNRRQRQIAQWRGKPFVNDHLDAFFNASVDAGIALSAFVIAAESVGLGCCPISAIRNHAQRVSDILQLPDHVFPVAGLALGWPHQNATISMRLPLDKTAHLNTFSEHTIREAVDGYDELRTKNQPYASQRYKNSFGESDRYGWSEDKARQYAKSERADFGDFVRAKGFKLD